jgi:molybdopterin adenylyltransferase
MKWKVAIIRCNVDAADNEADETTIQVLREMVEEDLVGEVKEVHVVPADSAEITATLYEMTDYFQCDLVFTLGGIGIGASDVVPEATERVIERSLPGLAEAMRAASLARDPLAMLSRGTAGVKGQALIVNLADDPRAILDHMQTIMPALHRALKQLTES